MLPEFEYGTLANQEDVQQLGKIDEQCFISAIGDSEVYFNRIGVENFRFIRRGKQVVGGLATIPMSQWYGGGQVPMTTPDRKWLFTKSS